MSTQTDAKEFTSISIQTDEIALPCIVNQLKKENKVLKQRVKRQSSSLTSLKEVVRTLHNKQLVTKTYEDYLISQFEGKKIVQIL